MKNNGQKRNNRRKPNHKKSGGSKKKSNSYSGNNRADFAGEDAAGSEAFDAARYNVPETDAETMPDGNSSNQPQSKSLNENRNASSETERNKNKSRAKGNQQAGKRQKPSFKCYDGIVETMGLKIGSGMPKICVPIVAAAVHDIEIQADKIMRSPADLVEWRADHFNELLEDESLKNALAALEKHIEGKPILFTLRTAKEGGKRSIQPEPYKKLYEKVIDSQKIDLIDVEFSLGSEVVAELIEYAHKRGVAVVISAHDFEKTPSSEEITTHLKAMKETGGDIVKMAVMPNNSQDVLSMLTASENMKHVEDKVPVITISMGTQGVITRMSGESFGSAVTFASIGKASAPGQIDADELDSILLRIHKNLGYEEKHRPLNTGKENIILIGFMGTGKSTVARIISKSSDLKSVELDAMIEKEASMRITNIFSRYGEEYFRDLESKQAERASRMKNAVISCGGGTVMRQKNVEALKNNGRIFLLNASPETIYDRVKRGGDKRPLLNKYMSRGYISWLVKKRSEAYMAAADYVIDVDRYTSNEVARMILKTMRRR